MYTHFYTISITFYILIKPSYVDASLKSIPKFMNKIVILLISEHHFSYSISIYGNRAAGMYISIYCLNASKLTMLFLISRASALNLTLKFDISLVTR